MNSLLTIADHLERFAAHVGDADVMHEARFIAHRCIEAEGAEDVFWLSLAGCIRQLSLNPKAQGVSIDLGQLAISCLAEAKRLGELEDAA